MFSPFGFSYPVKQEASRWLLSAKDVICFVLISVG